MNRILDNKKLNWIFVTILSVTTLILIYLLLPKREITIGAWTEGFFDPATGQLHPEKLEKFEEIIGKDLSIAHYYRGWEHLSESIILKELETIESHSWQPMLNVNPYYFDKCPAADMPLYKAIAQGNCDDFLHKAGQNLSNVEKPFFLLFAWEMNNKDLEWSVAYTQSRAEDFIAAWRHIHTVFKEEGADKIIWVFCPNTEDKTSVPYEKIYPGDKYVDWTCLDGYNWGTTQSWSRWSSFSGVFNSSYQHLTSIAPDKPVLIAEVNSAHKGGDKGEWYKNMLTQEIPYDFPQIKAVVLYNEDRTNEENVNWRVDISKKSLNSLKEALNSRFYK